MPPPKRGVVLAVVATGQTNPERMVLMPLRNKFISFLLCPFLLALFLLSPLTPYAWALQGNPALTQNTIILWTDGPRLKAITVVSLKSGQKPVDIMNIPIITRVDNNNVTTLEELYDLSGRGGLTAYLEKRFQLPIKTYFCIDQKVLSLVSSEVGPINWFGQKTSLLDIFEGTYTGRRREPEMEMQTLVQKILEPEILIKIPHLVWILTRNVETNVVPAYLFEFYQTLYTDGSGLLRKKGLPR